MSAKITLLKNKAASRIMKDGMWLMLGEGVAGLGSVIGVKLLTGVVAPPEFAEAALAIGLVTIMRNLFYQPFLQAALRFYAEMVRTNQTPFLKHVLVWYLRLATVWVLLSIVLTYLVALYVQPISLKLLIITALVLFTENGRAIEIALLNAARRQRPVALLRPLDSWGRPLLAVFATLFMGPTAAAILIGNLLAILLGCLIIYGFGVRVDSEKISPPYSEADNALILDLRNRIWAFAIPMVPIAIVEWILMFSNRYLLGAFAGLNDTGLYAAACSLSATPFLLALTAVENWLRPVYFDAVEEKNPIKSRRVFAFYLGTMFTICAIGVMGLFLLGDLVTNLMLAPQYRSVAPYLPIIGLGNSLFALSFVTEKVFHVYHRMQICLACRIVGAVTCVVASVPMIYYFGLAGAVWSGIIYYGAQFIATAVCAYYVERAHAFEGVATPA